MEIFSYHEGLGKWTEIGNSGMFRPEMLRPMGLPENVSGRQNHLNSFFFCKKSFDVNTYFSNRLGSELGASCYDQI